MMVTETVAAYAAKSAVVGAASTAAVFIGQVSTDDVAGPLVGVTGLVGLLALIYKLITDSSRERQNAERTDRIITHYEEQGKVLQDLYDATCGELHRAEDEIRVLKDEVSTLKRALGNRHDDV